jgi:hypothetical protein
MARKTEDFLTHRSRKINQFAAERKPALDVLFPPVVLFVGEKAVTV